MEARLHRRFDALAACAALGAGALGCNLAIGADDYSVGKSWGCVGSVAEPAAEDGEVTLTVQAFGFTSGEPFPGLSVQACDASDLDPPCAASATQTDAHGEAKLSVPSPFEGYVYATAPGMMDSLVYLSAPVVSGAAGATYALNVGTYADYVSNVMAATGTVDPKSGALWVNTEDCLGQPAAGVTLSLGAPWSADADAFYFQDGAPVAAQTQDETSVNDGVGGLTDVAVGGFADVTTGRPTLSAALASNGELVAEFSPIVLQQSLTYVWLMPTELP